MEQGPAAEVVVTVKSIAEDGMVTYPRIKLSKSATVGGGEGWNMSAE
jgi:hypothetical protein